MGKGTNSLKGKVTNKNAMYVEADVKSESKKPVSKKFFGRLYRSACIGINLVKRLSVFLF